jgi:hypothetical protein
MPGSVVYHFRNPSRTSIFTTLNVKCVVFRRNARHEDRRGTSTCVPIAIKPKIRQVA